MERAPEDTCWTMVRGARAGDQEARGAFARTYLAVVRTYLRARWRARADLRRRVDDAVQDVFMDCFRQHGALDRLEDGRPQGFRAFLFGIVRNVALRYEEQAGRPREESLPSGFEPGADGLASKEFDRAWAKNLLARAAARQERIARATGEEARRRVELLSLRFTGGLPIREIARRFGLDPAVVHREYAKAREEFKRALLEELAFEHPGEQPVVERECARLLESLR